MKSDYRASDPLPELTVEQEGRSCLVISLTARRSWRRPCSWQTAVCTCGVETMNRILYRKTNMSVISYETYFVAKDELELCSPCLQLQSAAITDVQSTPARQTWPLSHISSLIGLFSLCVRACVRLRINFRCFSSGDTHLWVFVVSVLRESLSFSWDLGRIC